MFAMFVFKIDVEDRWPKFCLTNDVKWNVLLPALIGVILTQMCKNFRPSPPLSCPPLIRPTDSYHHYQQFISSSEISKMRAHVSKKDKWIQCCRLMLTAVSDSVTLTVVVMHLCCRNQQRNFSILINSC